MANVLSHRLVSYAHEACSYLDLLLEVSGQTPRRPHGFVDRGRLVSRLERMADLGVPARVATDHFCPHEFMAGPNISALRSKPAQLRRPTWRCFAAGRCRTTGF